EMLKHLGSKASLFLRQIISDCLSSGLLPNEWKQATVYPIPKPYDWDSKLINTRPITLLETARKLTMKLFTTRLSSLLHENSVLKGSNFAGLPGGSCQTPIRILDALINDASQ